MSLPPLPILLPPLLPLQVICAALGAWLFHEKGRPIWTGALLGLVFGLAGLIVAAAVPTEADRQQKSVVT